MVISREIANEVCDYLQEFTRAHFEDFQVTAEQARPKEGYGKYPRAKQLADIALSFTSSARESYLLAEIPQIFASPQALYDQIESSINWIESQLEEIKKIQLSAEEVIGFCPMNLPWVEYMLIDMKYALKHAKELLTGKPASSIAAGPTEGDVRPRKIFFAPDLSLKDLWDGIPAKYLRAALFALIAFFTAGLSAGYYIRDIPALKKGGDTVVSKTVYPLENETEEKFVDSQRAALRRSNGLELLYPEQNEFQNNEVPDGFFFFSYGFYIPGFVNDGRTFKVYSEQGALLFEMHKRGDGSVWLIGYVKTVDKIKLTSTVETSFEISLFNLSGPGTELVEIEFERIIGLDQRMVDLGRRMAVVDLILKNPIQQ